MAVIQLKGARREQIGKGWARKARAAGQIPAVIYGHGEDPQPIAVDFREFELALRHHKGSNAIVNLNVGGGEVTALVRDVQYDPLSRAIIHLDFQHISLTEQIEVEVPVHFVGTPVGVKDSGGILEHLLRMLKVKCAECGCIVRMTRQWLDQAGAPTCACGAAMAEGRVER